ncbi:ABC transporter permease [Microbacterium oleivorans]|uniref:Putative ABC transporter permease protein n=1 Tax=Microbacterium oleivorans TaxID=273677 RepID=A0A031FVM7_9MICO|nr:ABC transporter permease subunit [Microbacterium oleivorans]AZS42820.1 putative multiple-sugar transport system permease YteP [Microbacterium oleivorans]EZP28347.1 putative ABC transporter permease protein [Microbacterium oleivorans]THE06160.1 sugar ABC transporter permease [Microbacterium oleivorans]
MTQQAIVTEAAAATIEEKAPHRTERPVSKNRRSFRMFLCIVPFLVLVFLFSYFPLYGWIYALFDYRPALGLGGSDFVGLQWFQLLVSSPTQVAQVGQVVVNTLAISFLGIATSVLPLAFAIFLNEIRAPWFRNAVQTLTTLPNFISWVLVYMIAFSLFSSSGLVNGVLSDAGLITTPVKFLDTDQNVWLTMTLWSVWKGLGWGAIIYLAAIAGIDQSLYESAEIDGAGRFQKMWYITVPQLMPTYLVLLLLSIANLLNNGMEQYFVFQNAFNKEHIQVLDLYVYNIGMTGNNLSMATAIGMLKSLISVILLFTVNGIAKRVRGESIV